MTKRQKIERILIILVAPIRFPLFAFLYIGEKLVKISEKLIDEQDRFLIKILNLFDKK